MNAPDNNYYFFTFLLYFSIHIILVKFLDPVECVTVTVTVAQKRLSVHYLLPRNNTKQQCSTGVSFKILSFRRCQKKKKKKMGL